MDTPNTPIKPQTPEAAATPPAIEPQVVFVKKTPMQMIGSLFSGLKPKPKSTQGASAGERPVPLKKIVIIMVGLFILLLVIVAVVGLLSRKAPAVIEPTPTPEATAPPVTPPPTRYSTDSGVLNIESSINDLDRELTTTDLDEVNIKPRSLRWEVRFDQ